jgi:hypothetical protein
MPFAKRPTRTAKRYTVVYRDIIANFRRFADDNARAVINEESSTDRGSRMNVHIRHKSRKPR